MLGSKLVFVLKLDECVIVKGQKLERMSVTLMNEALFYAKRSSTSEAEKPTFSVQSENEIWWLGAFEVPKETHQVLAWIFSRIPWVTDVIRAQIDGEKLIVPGRGEFDVEWHLGGDLKTIKCMLGCKQGANTLLPCPFCTKGHKTSRATPLVGQDNDENAQEDGEWVSGVLACDMLAEPDRDTEDPGWNPIIPFPLNNVHFCTLHAFMRIFDRLLKHHIDYAFTMKPIQRSRDSLRAVETLLNEIRCHKSRVNIVAETCREKTYEVVQKVSMQGAKARRFFKNMRKAPERPRSASQSVDPTTEKRWELWKDLCACTTDKDSNVENANQRKLVWSSFQKVVQLMNLPSTTVNQREQFKNVVYEFTKAVKDAWSESKIVHYMVCG